MSQSPTRQQQHVRPKLCSKIYNTSCDTLISLANEPSVAFYRIQEHLRIIVTESKLRGVNYDLGHITKALSTIPQTRNNLSSLLETANAVLSLQQKLSAKTQEREDLEMGIDVAAAL
ncbi:BLOC-1-related complex subunit 8 [Sparganum proliferum]